MSQRTLTLALILFITLITAAMYFWNGSRGVATVAILLIAGEISGGLWLLATRWRKTRRQGLGW